MIKTLSCGACGTGATPEDKFCIECGSTIVTEELSAQEIYDNLPPAATYTTDLRVRRSVEPEFESHLPMKPIFTLRPKLDLRNTDDVKALAKVLENGITQEGAIDIAKHLGETPVQQQMILQDLAPYIVPSVIPTELMSKEPWGDKEISKFWEKKKKRKPLPSERRGPKPNKRYLYGGESSCTADVFDDMVDTVLLAYDLPAVHDLHDFKKLPPQRPEPKLTSLRRAPRYKTAPIVGSPRYRSLFVIFAIPIISTLLLWYAI